jgi:hypothetical protein
MLLDFRSFDSRKENRLLLRDQFLLGVALGCSWRQEKFVLESVTLTNGVSARLPMFRRHTQYVDGRLPGTETRGAPLKYEQNSSASSVADIFNRSEREQML